MTSHIRKLYTKLKTKNLDCLILSSRSNIAYLTGYKSRDSYLIISKKGNIYLTDSRYTDEAKECLKGYIIKKIGHTAFASIANICRNLKFKNVGIEEKHLNHEAYRKMGEHLGKNIALVPTQGIVEESREIKSAAEIRNIKEAVSITIKALNFIKGLILPGKKEIEIAAELEHFIRYNGASASSFDIIVASGPNSAYPHHLTSGRKIKNNELVLIDVGVDYNGYKSDLTRVFFLGRINPLVRRVYDIIRKAQTIAFQKIKPAVPIGKIDTAARQYIAKKGYGGFFGHNLGHGIGLDVHEIPCISGKEDARLKPGMVFTVEPGIYLPGKFGIRIEDMVLVTERGIEVLSGALNK